MEKLGRLFFVLVIVFLVVPMPYWLGYLINKITPMVDGLTGGLLIAGLWLIGIASIMFMFLIYNILKVIYEYIVYGENY